MVCEFGNAVTFIDVFTCGAGTLFGVDWNIIAMVSVIFIAVLAYKFRLPLSISLPISFGVLYSFWVLSAGSADLVLTVMMLLGMAIAIKLIMGLMSYVSQTA